MLGNLAQAFQRLVVRKLRKLVPYKQLRRRLMLRTVLLSALRSNEVQTLRLKGGAAEENGNPN